MDLINIKVRHKIFGEGFIINDENPYITVRFDKAEKKFVYPDAFDGYLIAENSQISESIKKEIKLKKLDQEKKEFLAELELQNQIKISNDTSVSKKSKKKGYQRANIAFKCNFCDGGSSDKQVGFNGVCSDKVIKYNIQSEKHPWCSSEDSPCMKYLKGDITRSELEEQCESDGYVCYESQMLRDWKALAGIVQTGKKKGQPIKLNKVKNNSLCVLTTRDPNSTERERYIFGVFLVDETYEGNSKDEGYVTTNSKYHIKLSPEEAHKMLFWNYHANDSRPKAVLWSSGLHRYFHDEEAVQILQDIAKLKEHTDEENFANDFLSYFAKINAINIDNIPQKNGALMKK